MPNHITTQVEISGSKAKITKLIKDTGIKLDPDAEENVFDFNAIIPMPPSLHITSGSTTDLGMAAYDQASYNQYSAYGWFNERYNNAKTPAELKVFLEASDNETDKKALEEGKMAVDNLKKYGYKDWYDWANAKWGTKWNAYDVRYIAHSDTKLVLELQTAWNTPYLIWNALEAKGYTVRGVMFGEMDGHDYIGDGSQVFEAYETTEVGYYPQDKEQAG